MSDSDTHSAQRPGRRGRVRRARLSAIAGALLALAGCAADPEPTDPAGEREIIERAPEILGELAIRGGARLTFTAERERGAGDAAPVVAITELAPSGAPSYLARIRDRGATSLEAFLALAPAGTEAPRVLREAHAREAAALGRSAELRVVSLDAATVQGPADNPICDSFAAFTSAVGSSLNAEQTASSTENHSLTFHNGGHVQALMCNQDDQADNKTAQFCYEDSFGLLQCGSGITVQNGYLVSQLWINATTDRVVRAAKILGQSRMSYLGIGALPPAG